MEKRGGLYFFSIPSPFLLNLSILLLPNGVQWGQVFTIATPLSKRHCEKRRPLCQDRLTRPFSPGIISKKLN